MNKFCIIEGGEHSGCNHFDMLNELLSDSLYDGFEIGVFAKHLSKKMGYTIEREELIEWLKKKKYLMPSKFYECKPYQKYVNKKWFALKSILYRIDNGVVISQCGLIVFEKGQKQIVKLLQSEKI